MDLQPGFYWAEITFDRPTDGDTVLAALRQVGFSEAYLEHRDPPPGYGVPARAAGIGLRAGGMLADSIKASALSSNAVKRTAATSYAAQAAPATPPSPLKAEASVSTQVSVKPADPLARQASASTQVSVTQPPPPSPKAGAPAPVRDVVDRTPRAPREQAPPPPAPSTGEPYDPYRFGTDEQDGTYSSAATIDEAPPAEYEAEAADDAAYDAPSYGEPRPRMSSPTTRSVQPREDIVASAPGLPPVPPGCVSVGPSMFLCAPSTGAAKVAGARSTWRFPFIARLDRPVTLKNSEFARWTKAVALPFDPFAPMNFIVEPWTLDEGVVYGLRFLSRDRSVRSKNDVARILHSMGFDPVALFLAHRNMRVPRRNASCTEWIGFGRWTGPATVVTTDDPFYFAEARPYVDIDEEAS